MYLNSEDTAEEQSDHGRANLDLWGRRVIPGFDKLLSHNFLNKQEQIELSRQYREGGPGATRAADKLVRHHQRLVLDIAKRYQGRGLELEDLFQAGNVGLMKALKKMDPTRDIKFTTYAIWWVRQSIHRACSDEGRNVRLPVYASDEVARIFKAWNSLCSGTGETPDIERVAKIVDLPVKRVETLFQAAQKPASLDRLVHGTEDVYLLGAFSCPNSFSAEENANIADMVRALREIMVNLNDKERFVITRRHGLDGQAPMLFRELSNLLALTKQRVMQIEQQAIRKMKRQAFVKSIDIRNLLK
jgi:RNA polymerase sigma factor (sigma-70 family)